MPYKIDTLKIKLPPNLRRTVKYTQEDKDKVIAMHKEGVAMRAIARETGMSRRYVQFIIFPERLAHANALFKERRKDGRYYDKEKNRLAVKSCREWRKKHITI